jgi:hypothetical protein
LSHLVDASTGEILQTCTPDRARDLTDKIKTSLGVAWELVKEAYTSRAWAALGYESWDQYTSEEFGTGRLRLPREERPEVVASLRDAGMSIRAIAAATGDSPRTVGRSLSGGANATPDEDWTLDGNKVPKDKTGPPYNEPAPIIGIDGKTYPSTPPRPPTPPKPQRRALTDSFFDAMFDLTREIERLQRLTEDDRFSRNAEQVAARHRNDLLSAVEVLSKVLDQLPNH